MATTQSPHQRDYDKNPGQDEFNKLIDRNFSPGDERAMEERAKEGASEDLLKQSSAEKKETNLLGAQEDEGKSFYNKASAGSGGFKAASMRKKLLFGVGLGGVAAGGLTLLFFGFLNVFKLDHMMSNIDSKTFARLNGTLDSRSSKYINTYMALRLADIGDNPKFDKPNDPDNLILRANRVDNNNPLFDWYKTMRTSKFEQEIFEKYGFKFTSVAYREGNQIKRRPGFIQNKEASTKEFIRLSTDDMNNVLKGNVNELNGKLSKFVEVEAFASDKEGRRAIKRVVNDNTHWAQVFKRRQVRKAIQNMTGVRDWRFFEDKRNKFDEKKIDIRNKIISKAIPESTKTGKFVNCLFGISDCRLSRDPAAPENRAEGALRGDANIKNGDPLNQEDDKGKKMAEPDIVDTRPGSGAIKKISSSILTKANPALAALDFISTMDIMSDIHKAIGNGKISKGVAVARGVQAMGLYQVFSTSRDQIKSGEVQGAEVNAFMEQLGPITNNESYSSVINSDNWTATTGILSGKVLAAGNMTRDKYCSPEHQAELEKDPKLADKEFVYVCPDKQIGGSTRAASLEKSYESSIGKVLGPILKAYDGARSFPVVGKVVDGFVKVWSSISSFIVGSLANAVLSTLGLSDNVDKAMAWLTGKMISFLGAGPIMTGQEPAGVTMNWLVQGGAYTAEASSRMNGASVTTPESAMLAHKALALYVKEQYAQKSLTEKYLSMSEPDSFAANTVFSISQVNVSSAAQSLLDFNSLIKSVFTAFVSPFSPSAGAAVSSGYSAAELAGIQTYDFPKECHDFDPLSATPQSGTNIGQIIEGVPANELTWELVTNSNDWFDYIYAKLGDTDDADEKAEKIYNCHLLDTSIRGSLGYLYGYTNDNGLEESTPSSEDTQAPSDSAGETASATVDLSKIGEHSDSVACAEGTNDKGVVESRYRGSFKTVDGGLRIRLCQIVDIPGNGNDSSGQQISGGAIVNSRVSGAWAALAKKAKADGVSLSAFSSFRLADSCGGTGDGGLCASPGTSPHQLGVALDLDIGGSGSGSSISCSGRETANTAGWIWMHQNASKFGILQYSKEAWHWDVLKSLSNRCP